MWPSDSISEIRDGTPRQELLAGHLFLTCLNLVEGNAACRRGSRRAPWVAERELFACSVLALNIDGRDDIRFVSAKRSGTPWLAGCRPACG